MKKWERVVGAETQRCRQEWQHGRRKRLLRYIMRLTTALLFMSLTYSSGLLAQTETAPQPPVAPKIEHRETRHGSTVVDNYYWLREKRILK